MNHINYPRWASSALKLQNDAFLNLGHNPCISDLKELTFEVSIYMNSTESEEYICLLDKSDRLYR